MPIARSSFTDRGVKALPPPKLGQRFGRRRTTSRAEPTATTRSSPANEVEPAESGDADGGSGQVMTQIDWFDPDRQPPGFGVRVSRNGTRTWIYMYRHNGIKRRLKLGVVGEIGLKAARDLAWDAHEAVRKNDDPATARKNARARVNTVKDLATIYIAEYAKLRKSSWKKDEQILDREVIPFIGRMRAVDVARRDIRDDVLKRIVERGAPVRANHTLEIVRKMFNWAIKEKDFTFNPAALLEKPGGTPVSRSRYLLPVEFPRFWAALDPKSIGEAGCIAFKLLALTGQREMELLRARWRELDLDEGLWTIPASVAKNRRAHVIPLTPYAIGLFRRLRALAEPADEFVFQSRITPSHMRRVFYEKRILKIRKSAQLEDFTIHDLRRTATTYWSKLGVVRDLKKRLLNHAMADVTATYDRFEYLDEKREALTQWEELFCKMVGDSADPGRVSPRRAARGS
jgi:integrase